MTHDRYGRPSGACLREMQELRQRELELNAMRLPAPPPVAPSPVVEQQDKTQ